MLAIFHYKAFQDFHFISYSNNAKALAMYCFIPEFTLQDCLCCTENSILLAGKYIHARIMNSFIATVVALNSPLPYTSGIDLY